MNQRKLAEEVVTSVGGKENIQSVIHCMTRLRFVLKDPAIADRNKKGIEAIEGVLGVANNGGQFQVIIGNQVSSVYNEVSALIGKNDDLEEGGDNKKGLDRFFDILSGIFVPIIPAIAGAGMLKGLLILLTAFGWMSDQTNTYIILNVISDAVFSFLPILLAFNAAKKFRCNPMVAATVGAILLHPVFAGLVAEGNVKIDFIGIPFTMMNYASSVLPILIGIWLMSYIERFIKSWMPKTLDIIFTPLLTLLIIVPVILIVIGPLGILGGNMLSAGFSLMYSKLTFVAGAILGALYPLLVLTGMHYGLLPIMLQNLSTNGYDVILALCAAGNTAVAGAVFGVYLKVRSKSTKAVALSSTISGLIGVMEPGLYSVVIKYKKTIYSVLIGGAVGGFIMGLFQVKNSGFGLNPLGGLPVFFGDTIVYYLIGISVTFVISAITAYILGYPEADQEK
ncbi:PTS transporter subunit EIIC [Bacillus sp. FJAT-50079]|uniref:PTS transporter subunit EIIC n=1 Tax=Bacillus sp. FJAT-50079 TaxID=2833577 RepID=UPI001BC9B215|nr:PTS transporter subunit EIIC [Bacillus sp. FJAT-50079]MBS4207109.1 PTS transporter subunit EIIC [Bacillus sp. FJAT-50079]